MPVTKLPSIMDDLSRLPEVKTDYTSDEHEIMEKYFSSPDGSYANGGETTRCIGWKKIFYLSIGFVVLSNPWLDKLVSHLPYIHENPLLQVVVKMILFILFVVIIDKYAG